MKINNKDFQDWTEEELKVLLHNDTYRENNFIDYKVDFASLKCEDKNRKKSKPNSEVMCVLLQMQMAAISFMALAKTLVWPVHW